MPARHSFDYAILRVVPRVERGECFNVGVILYCRTQRFLAVSVELDEARLRALAPDLDPEALRHHLAAFQQIAQGGAGSGPIGALPQAERFHWLVAPRSTILQTSPVHSGLCTDPTAALEGLVERLVRL